MTKDEALELAKMKLGEYMRSATVWYFINWLYENGYVIITPEELEKINGMTIMAHVHGMNPFEKK